MGPRIARGSLETNSEADKDQGPAHVLCRVEGDHLRSRRPGQARPGRRWRPRPGGTRRISDYWCWMRLPSADQGPGTHSEELTRATEEATTKTARLRTRSEARRGEEDYFLYDGVGDGEAPGLRRPKRLSSRQPRRATSDCDQGFARRAQGMCMLPQTQTNSCSSCIHAAQLRLGLAVQEGHVAAVRALLAARAVQRLKRRHRCLQARRRGSRDSRSRSSSSRRSRSADASFDSATARPLRGTQP